MSLGYMAIGPLYSFASLSVNGIFSKNVLLVTLPTSITDLAIG